MKKGFTLVELLAVVLILGILTAVAVPQYKRSVERARVSEARPLMKALADAADRYVVEYQANNNGVAPSTMDISKFDIESKGTVSRNQLTTKNYIYKVSRGLVSATLRTGAYAGLGLIYQNGSFSCCGTQEDCDELGIDKSSGVIRYITKGSRLLEYSTTTCSLLFPVYTERFPAAFTEQDAVFERVSGMSVSEMLTREQMERVSDASLLVTP